MADEPDSSPPGPGDPRLEIPEVLRGATPRPDYDPVYGDRAHRPKRTDVSGMARAWAWSFEFVITILVGAGLGWLADAWRHSTPLWTMVGLGVGFVSAFMRIIRATQADALKTTNQFQSKGRGSGPPTG
jgi:F0F1-type ATP synthase assembly protein I